MTVNPASTRENEKSNTNELFSTAVERRSANCEVRLEGSSDPEVQS